MRRGGTVSNQIFGFLTSCSVVCLSIHVLFTPINFPEGLLNFGQSGSLLGEFRSCERLKES